MFSVVIITLNEEKIIEKCIKAARKVSDDIIVVDSESTDKTAFIAKEQGAKVFITKWLGYSETKNFGVSKAKYDWIISIDADEVLSNELINSINHLKPQPKTIYLINILSNFLGSWVKHSNWYPSWKKRIYNKKEFSWDGAEVHEALIGIKEFSLVKLKGHVFHYSYETENDVLLKTERYSKLLAKEMIKNGKNLGGMKRLFGPIYKFIYTYFIKLGILDGKAGYKISKMNATVVRKKIYYYHEIKKSLKK